VGIPLPASTQWGIVLEIFKIMHPVYTSALAKTYPPLLGKSEPLS
jgi:hypothetical protein